MENEVWKDVPGYKGLYQVSSLGRVKSLSRIKLHNGKYPIKTKEVLLKYANHRGYYAVRLYKNNKSKTIKVHQLVAMAFLNHEPCGYKIVINHKNFKRIDNRVENLELVTSRENTNLKHIKSSSKYVGVRKVKNKKTNKYRSVIKINGVQKHLGYFQNEYEAHLAYQNKLKEITT